MAVGIAEVFVALAAAALAAWFWFTRRRSSSASSSSLAPPVVALHTKPFVGHALMIAKDPWKLLSDARQSYGEMFTLSLLGLPVTVIGAKYLKEYNALPEEMLAHSEGMEIITPPDLVFGRYVHANPFLQQMLRTKLNASLDEYALLSGLSITQQLHEVIATATQQQKQQQQASFKLKSLQLVSDHVFRAGVIRLIVGNELSKNQALFDLMKLPFGMTKSPSVTSLAHMLKPTKGVDAKRKHSLIVASK